MEKDTHEFGMGCAYLIISLLLGIILGASCSRSSKAESLREACTEDYVNNCSAYTPFTASGNMCMRQAGRHHLLSRRCLLAINASGMATKQDRIAYGKKQ